MENEIPTIMMFESARKDETWRSRNPREEANSASRREKYSIHNSLVAVPIMLLHQSVLIDMRNETSIAGRIINADGFMNIMLEEVVFIDQKGLQYEYDEFMIKAKNIRQIHLPDSIAIVPELEKFLDELGVKTSTKRSTQAWRMKRAEDKHKVTVKELQKE